MTVNICITNVNKIISELESIRAGILRDFSGIGEDYCANSLQGLIDKYYNIRKQLYSIDYSKKDNWEG